MSQNLRNVLALVAIFVASQWEPVSSHGRLWTPPGRATMWKKGFSTPTNNNDNQMFCGGLSYQKKMGYKCGICGDPYDSDRPHEAGGKYATGTIVATYTQGQEVNLQVDLTANHKGWFEFKLCPVKDYKTRATQECLDRHVLQLSDGSGSKLYVGDLGSAMVTIPVMLPKDLVCEQCVLQWHYHCGNNWGTDPDGKSCVGCGYTSQEEFYGCADVRITANAHQGSHHKQSATVSPDILKRTTKRAAKTPTTAPSDDEETTTPFVPPHLDNNHNNHNNNHNNHSSKTVLECHGVSGIPGMTAWCNNNCNAGNCPSFHCKCKRVPLV